MTRVIIGPDQIAGIRIGADFPYANTSMPMPGGSATARSLELGFDWAFACHVASEWSCAMLRSALVAVLLICAGTALAEGETVPQGVEPAPDTPACAPANRIHSWSLIDDRHVYLKMLDRRRRFLVTFLGPCKDAKWSTIIALARGSVGKCLWAGDQLVFRRMPMDLGTACWIEKIEAAPPADPVQAPTRKAEPERPATF